jgi:CBS domain-containing protein
MKAKEIMTAIDLTVTGEDIDVRHVAQLMAENSIGAIPVLDSDGRLEGIITDRDLCCRILAKGRSFETPVRDVMSGDVFCVDPDANLKEIEETMREHKVRRVPVVDDNQRLQGFISLADLVRAVEGSKKEEQRLAEVMEEISQP